MNILKIVILSLICAGTTFAQNVDENRQKATDILTKAGLAISKTRKNTDVKGINLKTTSFVKDSYKIRDEPIENETSIETEISVQFLNKMKLKSNFDSKNFFRGTQESNQSSTEQILNGAQFSNLSEAFVNGEKVELPLKYPSKQEGIAAAKTSSFINIFPILLNVFWTDAPNYKYVGTAESKSDKAEIIEVFLSEADSFRLFFDQKTGLLLMMIQNTLNKQNIRQETKHYFSDYQEKDGLLVANKIKIEKNGKIMEERKVNELKINPTFRADFFNVRK